MDGSHAGLGDSVKRQAQLAMKHAQQRSVSVQRGQAHCRVPLRVCCLCVLGVNIKKKYRPKFNSPHGGI